MAKSITPLRLLIGAGLAFAAWVFFYVMIYLGNAIWPASAIR